MLILFLGFAAITTFNICYYLGFLEFAFAKSPLRKTRKAVPVSIIICAKNEAENLRKFLPAVLNQDYPDFEIVVINDASSDETLEVIETFQKQDDRVQLVNVKNNEAFWANKKYALTLGIKKAAHPFLLFTDADCEPETPYWISEMTTPFLEGKSIVLGYGGYFRIRKSFLNKLIRFETLLTAVQYFSYARLGVPYMGVGRNLAYTSEEFYKQSGFATHLHLRSGDDDLFVNKAATRKNTGWCFSDASFTRSIPKKSFSSWFHQKRRHVSVAGQYKIKHRILLSLFYLSQFLFWILLVPLLFSSYWKSALAILMVRLLVQGLVFFPTGKKLKENDLIWIFPFLELFLVCAQFCIFISNTISKPNHWK